MIEFVDIFELESTGNATLMSDNYNRNMSKNFEIEIKDDGRIAPYLKAYLKADADFSSIATHLQLLHSVRKVNVTNQLSGKTDLTIYPAKVYSLEEVKDEVSLTLKSYYDGSPIDPSFLAETISSISDKAYFQIIDHIIKLGKNLESFHELNQKFDEERYRDYFMPFLNSISKQHAAKPEVFNRKGKTDIIMFDHNGNNVFIAECKLWKGERYLTDAIDQLLKNYVNWRDEKLAIIIFNRDMKKFTDLINTANKATDGHTLCAKSIGKRADASYSYIFKNPDDDQKTVKLELILLNFA